MLDKFFKTIEKITPQKWRWILSHEGFRRYFANTGWMFFGQMFSLLVSFFIGAWLARYLGPENYGVLSYAVAFVGVFSFISSLGVDEILFRELVKFPEKRDALMGTAFWLKLAGGLIAFFSVIIFAFLFVLTPLSRILIVLFSLTFILQSFNVISIYFQAKVQSKSNIRAILLATLIASILKIAVILLNQGVIWIIIVYVLDLLMQGIGFVNAYNRCKLKIRSWHFDKNLAKEMLKNSWPLMLSSAAVFIYLRVDQVMIGAMLGSHAVGLYAAAVKLVEAWNFIPYIICGSLLPAIINAKKTDALIYKKRLKALYLLIVIAAILIAVISTIFAPWIVNLLFGSEYLGTIIILQIYAWSAVGFFLSIVITKYFLSENRSQSIFWYNLLSMSVNVVLNFVMIPAIGLIGAALATLISYSVGPVVMVTIWWFENIRKKKLLSNI